MRDDASATAAVTYGNYLRLDELLQLQHPRSAAAGAEHPDELLFIVVHQASELWFKVVLHELDGLRAAMTAPFADGAQQAAERALWHAGRLNALTRIVAGQLAALDTLPPQRFLQFRGYLGSSSGSQSVQFRAIEASSGLRDDDFLRMVGAPDHVPAIVAAELAKPTLQSLFLGLLDALGVELEALYVGPGPSSAYLLAEQLLEYDQQFARWRFGHVQLVERIIGPMTMGTGGSLGASYLSRTTQQRFFPALWSVRSRLYGAARAAAQAASTPTADGSAPER